MYGFHLEETEAEAQRKLQDQGGGHEFAGLSEQMLAAVAELISDARNIVFFTGAGTAGR